jgi:hypothetical protein
MSRRRAGASNLVGGVLIVLVMLTLGAFGAAAFLLRAPPLYPETLCRVDQPLAAHTIILVDSTDRLEPRHRRKLRAVLDQERARLAQYERLTVMRLNARAPQEPTILFSKCLPRPPDQTNPLFENARHVQARWDNDFGAALDRALRSATSAGRAQSSPLLAGLRAVAADAEFGAEIQHRRLVLVSDLLEHDPQGFSLYVSDADYAAWRQQSTAGPPDLAQVEVRVVPLDRPDDAERQIAALERFWPDYFDATEARSVSFDPAP